MAQLSPEVLQAMKAAREAGEAEGKHPDMEKALELFGEHAVDGKLSKETWNAW